MVKIKKTNEIRIKLGRKKREKETRKERKNKEKRREGGRKQRKERGGEREKDTMLHERRHVEIRPRRLRVFFAGV